MNIIIIIYASAILYILLFFIHKILTFVFSLSRQLRERYYKRAVYRWLIYALDLIFNIYFLITAFIIITVITTFIIIIYIYYKFLLIPISKVWPIGCEMYKIFAFFPITDIKLTGIFQFLDFFIFKSKILSDILIKLILEHTIKHNISHEMFKNIEKSIYKDLNTELTFNDICGDTRNNRRSTNTNHNVQTENVQKETNNIDSKQKDIIKQCVYTLTPNNTLYTKNNYINNMKNKLLYNICASKSTNL